MAVIAMSRLFMLHRMASACVAGHRFCVIRAVINPQPYSPEGHDYAHAQRCGTHPYCLDYPVFIFSALVLLQYGMLLVKFLMSHSSFYAWDLAMRTLQGDMMPAGVITMLLMLSILAIGSALATAALYLRNGVISLAGPFGHIAQSLR